MKIYQDAEKLVNDQFHKETYDGARSKFDVAAIVGDALVAKHRAADPYHDPRPGFVHASSLYGCLRGVFYQMMGMPEESQEEFTERRMAGVFEAGHLFEEFIVKSLGDRVLEQQREYEYKYKSLTLVGHSDYRVLDGEVMRIGENKSVNSQAFWYRKNEGTLIAWHNQIQLQIYLWLERILFKNSWEGIFSYISKDDCTIEHAAVKYNPVIIEETVKPILDLINTAYEAAMPIQKVKEDLHAQLAKLVAPDAEASASKEGDIAQLEKEIMQCNEQIIAIGQTLPAPALAIYDEAKHQYQQNWLCKYCHFHQTCAGAGWALEAMAEVKRLNAAAKAGMPTTATKAAKPTISVSKD